MAFQDRLTVVIDFVTGPAQSGLKKLRTDVAQAEGAMGKAKVAASGLGGALQQYAGQAALAAGAALVTFGVKSVKAFQDGALAAGKFADAAGISIEAASRFTAVADDLGISGETVQGAIQKMNLAIANGKPGLDQFADSIVRAKDGTVDSAATFQNLVTEIGAIRDSTERAKVAQEVFGKSYGEIARLMEMSAGDLAERLNSVSDAQIFDPEERAKAQQLERAMDDLQDRVLDLQLALGEELVPALTDFIDTGLDVVDVAGKINQRFKQLTGVGIVDALSGADTAVDGLSRAFDGNNNSVDRLLGGTQALVSAIPILGDKMSDLIPRVNMVDEEMQALAVDIAAGTDEAAAMADMYGQRVPPAIDTATGSMTLLEEKTYDAQRAAQRVKAEWDGLFDNLNIDRAALDLQDQFAQLEKASLEAFYAAVSGADDAEQKQRDYQREVINTQEEVAKYADEILNLPPDQVTKFIADLDEGERDAVLAELERLAKTRTVRFVPFGEIGYEKRAKGGPIGANRPYLVGEEGPELIVPGQSGMVIPNHRLPTTGGGGSMMSSSAAPMVVNITTGADPEDVVRAIERYRKRNGSLPFI
jgi:hypothetical protein